jgi:hypothetical protein
MAAWPSSCPQKYSISLSITFLCADAKIGKIGTTLIYLSKSDGLIFVRSRIQKW